MDNIDGVVIVLHHHLSQSADRAPHAKNMGGLKMGGDFLHLLSNKVLSQTGFEVLVKKEFF